MKNQIKTVDDYISEFPTDVRGYLESIRSVIKNEAPKAVETISYAMPAYKLNKRPLVYFAGYARHIGFYATPTGHEQFRDELSNYKRGKGSVQFSLDEPLPLKLIARIVRYRVQENMKLSGG